MKEAMTTESAMVLQPMKACFFSFLRCDIL